VKANQLFHFDPASLPAVLAEQDAVKPLGMKVAWFETLAKKKHLQCLGGYHPGCPRYYATKYILALKDDLAWLDEAFRILRDENKGKNSGNNDNEEATS
jgi:hypothetical protein